MTRVADASFGLRILILDTCYPAFLRAHYDACPGLEQRSYSEQWHSLMDTFFGTADSYSFALGELGHDAHEVVANCEPLQRAWASENRRRTTRAFLLTRERIVEAQVSEFAPDVVYVQNLRFFSGRLLRRLRRRGALIVGQIASEPPGVRKLRCFDLLLTSFPHFVERFRSLGVAAELLGIGFDPRVLDRLADRSAMRDLRGAVFVGALNRTQHRGGNDVLDRAARRTEIDFWGYRAGSWPADSPIARRYHGEAWGLDMFRILYESRIALNRHVDVAGDYANNMRLYEATGVGTLLITDEKANLHKLFEPGKELVTYRDEDELVERIRYFLEEDDERRAIARAGQDRTLRDHTYHKRMEELVPILEARL